MTEKRFRIINGAENLVKYGIFCKPVLEDGETGEQYILALDLMDLLNELHEENKKLRIVNEMMSADMVDTERELNEKIETLEKEIVKLENGWEYLLEENTRLEKFFLHNCKSQDFIDWVKMLAEEGENCKRQ